MGDLEYTIRPKITKENMMKRKQISKLTNEVASLRTELRSMTGLLNILIAHFASEGALLTEEKLDEYFKTHTVKATVEPPPGKPEIGIVKSRSDYADIIPVVIETYNDRFMAEYFKKKKRRMSYRGVVMAIYNAPDIPQNCALYTKIMVARENLCTIIRNKQKSGVPNAAEKSINSLLTQMKRTISASKRKPSVPGPVAIDYSLSGGGMI